MKKRSVLAVASGTSLALFGVAAEASLVLLGSGTFSGSGVGAVNTVLTVQSPGNSTTETGAVVANGAGQTVSGDALTGASQTTLRTLGSIGAPSAADFRVALNAAEPGGDNNSITLSHLALTVYSPTGATLFNSGAFTPQTFPNTFSGIGNAGFVFGLDSAQQALAATAFSNPNNRVGLSASLTNATGGPDTFFVAAVPEPSTWMLMGMGLLGMFGIMRRRLSGSWTHSGTAVGT